MLPVVVLTCQVLASVIERVAPSGAPRGDAGHGFAQEIKLLDYGLHRVPVKLTRSVQESLDEIGEPSLVVLGYGLCGNGLRGIRAGKHTLLIPRTDDCIAVLLGSYGRYMREFGAVPGTIYLSKGWLESGSHPLKEYEEYSAKYGKEQALWVLDQQYQHYERLVLVASTPEEMARYRPQALEVARFCERWGMRYEEILGSDGYVEQLVRTAVALRDGALDATGVSRDFLVIPPGGEIRQEMFMR